MRFTGKVAIVTGGASGLGKATALRLASEGAVVGVAVPEQAKITDGMVAAFAPTGEMAAFCTAWYDDVTRTAYFEPVGTAPEHQRRGLGRAVLAETLRRLQRIGCVVAFVGGYSIPANALYASAGFAQKRSTKRTRNWRPPAWFSGLCGWKMPASSSRNGATRQ